MDKYFGIFTFPELAHPTGTSAGVRDTCRHQWPHLRPARLQFFLVTLGLQTQESWGAGGNLTHARLCRCLSRAFQSWKKTVGTHSFTRESLDCIPISASSAEGCYCDSHSGLQLSLVLGMTFQAEKRPTALSFLTCLAWPETLEDQREAGKPLVLEHGHPLPAVITSPSRSFSLPTCLSTFLLFATGKLLPDCPPLWFFPSAAPVCPIFCITSTLY